MADRFFAEPKTSVLGWERAVDAQTRIVACVRSIAEQDATPGDLAIVAHGDAPPSPRWSPRRDCG